VSLLTRPANRYFCVVGRCFACASILVSVVLNASAAAARAQQSPSLEAVVRAPATIALPARDTAAFVLPIQRAPDAPVGGVTMHALFVSNKSDEPATLADDGQQLTISASSGFILVPDADCTSVDGQPNDLVCPHALVRTGSISFLTAPLTAAQPLPLSLALSTGDDGVLLASPDSANGAPPAVGLAYTQNCCAQTAPSVDVSWDGANIALTAPPGFAVQPSNQGDCSVAAHQANVAVCPTTGSPPFLLSFTTRDQSERLHPPGTPLGPEANIRISVPPSPGVAGQSMTFTGSATPIAGFRNDIRGYIWDFGDGSTAEGETVSHVYALPGVYTLELIPITSAALSANGAIVQVLPAGSPPPPASVGITYSAGWNLVSGPAGTVLGGVSGSLYKLTVDYPETSYEAVPSDTPLEAGAGYWAYFDRPTTVTLRGPSEALARAIGMQVFNLIGNPLSVAADVSGADLVEVYDPSTGQYEQTTALAPGQGAWAYSATGLGEILISYPTP
jgi:hypothetical protein